MIEYRKRDTGNIFNEWELRATAGALLPMDLTVEICDSLGVDPVFPMSVPEVPGKQIVRDGAKLVPVAGNDTWVQNWKYIDLPSEDAQLSMRQAQDKVWTDIKDYRDYVQAGGIQIDDHWFHTTTGARTRYAFLDSIARFKPVDPPFTLIERWETMDGSVVAMSNFLLVKIMETITKNDDSTHWLAKEHQEKMLKADNPLTYNYKTGWPAIFSKMNFTG